MKKHTSAFTLIELMVVISILSLMSSIILASVNGARIRAQFSAGVQTEANMLHGIGDKLVGYWSFDDAPISDIVADYSSYNNTALRIGATYFGTGGYNGKGFYQFNGSIANRLESSGVATLLGTTNDFTISAWIKPTNPSTGLQGIITTRCTPGMTGLMGWNNNELIYGYANSWITGTGLFPKLNEWNFIALSISPTKATLFLNDKTKTISGSFTPIQFGCGQPLRIGTDISQGGIPGIMIDNVRVYSEAFVK